MAGSAAVQLAGGVIGRATGVPLGGVIGARAAGMLWEASARPVRSYLRMARLAGTLRGYEQRFTTGAERLRSAIRSGQLGDTGGGRAVRTASRVVIGLRGTPDERRAEYRTVTAELRELATSPEALAERIEPTIGAVAEASPALADSMATAVVRGVAYLVESLPAVDTVPTLLAGALEPSQWEIDQFLRRFSAVEDPLSLFDRAAEGSLHVEHREAVAAVYPEVYSEIQAGVLELLAEEPKRPSYPVRLQLGVLMGVPSDRSLLPDMIAALQSQYAQTTAQDATIHGQRAGRLDDSFSSTALSRSDEIASRL